MTYYFFLAIFKFRLQRHEGTALIVSERKHDPTKSASRVDVERDLQHALPDFLKGNGKAMWFHEIAKLPELKYTHTTDVTLLTAMRHLESDCINVHPVMKGGICIVTVTNSKAYKI